MDINKIKGGRRIKVKQEETVIPIPTTTQPKFTRETQLENTKESKVKEMRGYRDNLRSEDRWYQAARENAQHSQSTKPSQPKLSQAQHNPTQQPGRKSV